MLPTSRVLRLLQDANPERQVREDHLRHALRRGLLERPPIFAGRLVWSEEHIVALAAALDIKPPDIGSTGNEVKP